MMNFASPIIQPILSYILDPMVTQIGYLVKHEANLRALSNALRELCARRDDVKDKISVAETHGQSCVREVSLWLDMVDEVEGEVATILNDHARMTRCLCGCCLNCWSSYRIGKRAAKKNMKVVDLHNKGAFGDVATRLPPCPFEEMPIMGVAVGQNLYFEEVRRYLSDDGVGIVGIHGMGGVGKTTLLKRINNELADGFQHVIWVVVSREFELVKLQKHIAKRLGLAIQEDETTQSIATAIFNFLKNKFFLFLLDDLWESLDLDAIGIPCTRKVVFTTRFEQVCGNMEAHTRIKVGCLKPDEAWHLFEEKVGKETINSNRRIQSLVPIVANECGGLPLALITIGRAMSTKKTPQEWEHAITLLKKSQLQKIPGMENKMLPSLKFSYDSLQDDTMRGCFLCCSLWPEDYLISKDELIECWIGLGLVDDFEEIDEAYNLGHSLIGSLKEACLLEVAYHHDPLFEDRVKMHDVIRDMALWIASECGEKKNKWMVRSGVGMKEAPKDAKKWAEAERISLMLNDFKTLPHPPNCPNLLTLMIQKNESFYIIPQAFLQRMPALTYLDLSGTGIKKLPPEIGTVVNLQYLNLSHSSISSLPNELGCLVKLKYLMLKHTPRLRIIPHGVLSRLTMLRALDLFLSVYSDWEVGGIAEEKHATSIDELECLEKKGLKELGISIKTVCALQGLSSIANIPTLRLCLFHLEDFSSLKQQQQLLSPTLLGSHSLRQSLKELLISQSNNLEELMMNGGGMEKAKDYHVKDWCLPRLEILKLMFLNKLKKIIWMGVVPAEFLPNLRRLEIVGCFMLKNVTWVLKLPCLEILHLEDCFDLVEVISDLEDGGGGGGDGGEVEVIEEADCVTMCAFPSLRRLILYNLQGLNSICSPAFAFPCLEYIWVGACQRLKKLPFRSHTNKLQEIHGGKRWWEGLESEDNNIKSSLLPYFREMHKK